MPSGLIDHGIRTIRRTGVHFTPPGGPRRIYCAPELAGMVDRKVRVWYDPSCPDRLLLSDDATGTIVAETAALDPDPYGHVRTHRMAERYREELRRRRDRE